MENSTRGPDGFLILPADVFFNEHLLLNDYLLEEELRELTRSVIPTLENNQSNLTAEVHGLHSVRTDFAKWKKLPKQQVIGLIKAILHRVTWLYKHDAELEASHLARPRLIKLLRFLYTMKLPCNEQDLCTMLELTVPLLGAIAPYGPVDLVMEYHKKNELIPELCHALRDFQANLREEMSESQAHMQSLRQCLHMLLWLDELEPLDPSRCWSECVRRDFRAMTGDRRVKWRRLLKHIRANVPPRPSIGWNREGEKRLAEVGLNDFREQFCLWFASFHSGQALPLSVAGSHLLRGLIWYGALTRDEQIKECALGLMNARWKQKRNIEKSLVALELFGVTKEELRSRKLIKPELSPAPFPQSIGNVMMARVSNTWNHIVSDPDGDLIVVQGELHFYRLFRSKLRIERVSDNAVLELDWLALPDYFRQMINRECNSYDQLRMRGLMLIHDSIFGRYFVVK